PPPDLVYVLPRLSMAGVSLPAVRLEAKTGILEYALDSGERRALTPMSDGRPALQTKGAHIVSACQGGDVLAVQVAVGSSVDVWLIAMARAAVVGSLPSGPGEPDMRWFALSRDGARFARRVGAGEVEVRDVPGDRPPVLVTPREHLWVHFASLGRSCLLVRE